MKSHTSSTCAWLAGAVLLWGLTPAHAQYVPPPQLAPNVDYNVPNYANSPALTKFVDSLPGLTAAGANNLGQYIPVAIADTNSFSGADYYELALVDYTEKMHSELGPTKLRGYVQVETTNNAAQSKHVPLPGGLFAVDNPHYLGPTIVATKDRPTRIKFYNLLPVGPAGDLFIPTDVTVMGAGMGPDGSSYSQNRATLHLHGGDNPWISDGTAHQWITPAGQPGTLIKGVSQQNVPDMPAPAPGSATFYWPNGQSGRLMFFHDHAYGLTRLDVYAGEAAGYLLLDPNERALNTFAPGGEIPLIIQDKTFVSDGHVPTTFPAGAIAPADTGSVDPLWTNQVANPNNWGQTQGSLWFPHVYMPNQNPNDLSGANPVGRWDYGAWFWPVFPSGIPPTTSIVPESFMDTPMVNGTAYPYLNVNPTTYRFRVLNACNDRYVNLQFYVASPIISAITVTSPGTGYTLPPIVTITDPTGKGASATATIDTTPGSPTLGQVTGITVDIVGSGYSNPSVTLTPAPGDTGSGATAAATLYNAPTEVGMLPAVKSSGVAWPAWWTSHDTPGMTPDVLDGRPGGVPNPATMGPSFIHIGSEGGISPTAVELKNTPIGYEQNKRSVTVLNTLEHTLFLGPAERADIMVDFSQFAGKTLIVYNDAPAPLPAGDPRYDYYTANPDNTASGGAPSTMAGFGPNTRTVMQIRVASGSGQALDTIGLSTGVASTFAATQPATIVPSGVYARISDTSLTWSNTTTPLQSKTIQELFDPLGRMNATLGVELPFTTATIQTTLPYSFIDPATEVFPDGTTQLWKITHNGVDTHAIHFHLFNVQVVNRVGWDGAIKPPYDEELGWKETVKMNPLEDIVVALRAKTPSVPFQMTNNIRPLDPAMPLGDRTGYLGMDPSGNPVAVSNIVANFGDEYTWHCHLLGHEENDMMRPMMVAHTPAAPTLAVTLTGSGTRKSAVLTWNGAPNVTGFTVQRATDAAFTANLVTTQLGNVTTYTDPIGNTSQGYYYRVIAVNTVGSGVPGYPMASASSPSSNVAGVQVPTPPAAPSNLAATILSGTQVQLTWRDNANNETGYRIERSVNNGAFALLTTTGANFTSYTDSSVTVGNTYTYRVAAVNAAGNSAFVGPVSVVLAVPAAPSNVAAVGTRVNNNSDRITVTWTDNATTETGYTVQYATNSGFTGATTVNLAANTATYTLSGLPRARTYYFRVQASNVVGGSGWVNATPFPITTP